MIQTVQRFYVACSQDGCDATVSKCLPERAASAAELYASQNGWQVLRPVKPGEPRRHFCPAHRRKVRDA